jgi:dolichyl-diphosphooligosaccharide--protein glycosyltransferase
MFAIRVQAFDRFVQNGHVFFSGNDAYYHFRETAYAVEHWPFTMPFDPWTYFPYGTSTGQFGTLYDQLMATGALVVGGGSPSEQTVALTVLVAPAVIGALLVVPVYLLGRYVGGRPAGLGAVLTLALLPGSILQRSTVGFADHHIAEVFFQATAVVAIVAAITVTHREAPVVEQLQDRDWAGLRRTALWAAIAGIAMALYILVWPPGVILLGIFGLFVLIAMPVARLRGDSPEHLGLLGGAVALSTALVVLVRIDTITVSTTRVSPLQVLLAFGLGLACLLFVWFDRQTRQRGYGARAYTGAVFGSVVLGALVTALVAPRVFDLVVTNIARTIALGQSATTLTVAEAQPTPGISPFDPATLGTFFRLQYGLTHVTALIGLAWFTLETYRRDRFSGTHVFVLVWGTYTLLMALTQVRFHYYFAIVVAVFTGWLLARVARFVEMPSIHRLDDVEGYQILAVFAVVLVVVAPLSPLLAGSATAAGPSSTEWAGLVAQQSGPGSSTVWGEANYWVRNNTPKPGTYGDANDPMEYYGQYQETDDFAYPEGAYGIMSWWDYGHWITIQGQRIPNANPFQQGPRTASAYLQSTNETRANLLLEALPSLREQSGSVDDHSTAALRSIVEGQSSQRAAEDTQYVMIDDKMAGGKFGAITRWAGPETGTYFTREQFSLRSRNGTPQNVTLPTTTGAYEDTMLAKLYLEDANGLEHYRLVHETNRYSVVGGVINARTGRVRTLSSFRIGPWSNRTQRAQQSFTRAQRSNQAVAIGGSQYAIDPRIEASVKTFERVPGATLTGTVNETNDTTVMAYVRMNVTNSGRQFTYFTEANATDGEFSMTVPYATDDTVGPAEGGTDQSVEAVGNYTVVRGNPFQPAEFGRADVPDGAVRNGESIEVEMSAPPTPEEPAGNASNDSATNTTVETPTPEGESGQEETDDESSGGTTATPTPGALVFPEWLLPAA